MSNSIRSLLRLLRRVGMGEPLLKRHSIELPGAGESGGGGGRDVSIVANGSVCAGNIARRLGFLRGATIIVSMDGATATFLAIGGAATG